MPKKSALSLFTISAFSVTRNFHRYQSLWLRNQSTWTDLAQYTEMKQARVRWSAILVLEFYLKQQARIYKSHSNLKYFGKHFQHPAHCSLIQYSLNKFFCLLTWKCKFVQNFQYRTVYTESQCLLCLLLFQDKTDLKVKNKSMFQDELRYL